MLILGRIRENYDTDITKHESTEGVPYLGQEPDFRWCIPQHRTVPSRFPLPSYTNNGHQVTSRQACVGRPLYFHLYDSSFGTL